MSKKDYIPSNDAKFLEWAKFLAAYFEENSAKWGLSGSMMPIDLWLTDYETKLQKASAPNRGKVDILEKNEAKKTLVRECRKLVQGLIARNPFVSDADREKMGLTIYDTTPTTVAAPSAPCEADLKFPAAGLVELINIRAVGEPADRKAAYGARIYYGVMGEPDAKDKFRIEKPPLTGNDLPHSVFTRQKKYRFDFTGEGGKQVFFCLRYENSKGQPGPWGKILQAHVP
jgi:hypothetical protein